MTTPEAAREQVHKKALKNLTLQMQQLGMRDQVIEQIVNPRQHGLPWSAHDIPNLQWLGTTTGYLAIAFALAVEQNLTSLETMYGFFNNENNRPIILRYLASQFSIQYVSMEQYKLDELTLLSHVLMTVPATRNLPF